MSPASKAQQRAVKKYMQENYDEFKLRTPKGKKDEIKAHAESRRESVNAFINRAIDETIARDNEAEPKTTAAPPADEPASTQPAEPAEPIKRPRTIEELWALQSRNRQEKSEEEHLPLPWE